MFSKIPVPTQGSDFRGHFLVCMFQSALELVQGDGLFCFALLCFRFFLVGWLVDCGFFLFFPKALVSR